MTEEAQKLGVVKSSCDQIIGPPSVDPKFKWVKFPPHHKVRQEQDGHFVFMEKIRIIKF